MSPKVLGFVRGIGTVVLVAILAYLGDAVHLSVFMSDSLATVIAAAALAAEHGIEAKGGGALFGTVRVRQY